MLRGRRTIGCLGLVLFLLVLAAIGLFGAYRWSMENRSVILLDKADRLFGADSAPQRVSYGDDPAQHLLVYAADKAEPSPIVVFFHGGSWAHGSPDEYGFVARALATEDYAVVLAGYRLGHAGRFPAMLEDGAAAIAWVHRHAGEFGGDPKRIFLLGHSAGAYNAAMLALDRQWLGREGLDGSIIRGMAGLAGPYDFLPLDDQASIDAFGHWQRLEATQPTSFARADAPPMLLATGSADRTVRPRNSIALARVLTAAGAPAKLREIEGLDHVGILITLARPLAWRDSRVKDAVLAFLRENRDRTPASAPVQPENP